MCIYYFRFEQAFSDDVPILGTGFVVIHQLNKVPDGAGLIPHRFEDLNHIQGTIDDRLQKRLTLLRLLLGPFAGGNVGGCGSHSVIELDHRLMKPAIKLLVHVVLFVLLRQASFHHLFKGINNALFHHAGLELQQAFPHYIAIDFLGGMGY